MNATNPIHFCKKCILELPTAMLWVGMLLVLTWSSTLTYAQNATLTSVVNRNSIGLNESFMLLVRYTDQVSSDTLDVSPLQRDFEILGITPNSSSSVSIINGQTTREATTSWRITLLPKRSGTLVIPALSLKGASSQPITIQIEASPTSTNQANPLSAEVLLDKDSIYPGEQLLLRVEITAAANVGNLNGPSLVIDGAEVVELDQQVEQVINNGIAQQKVSLLFAVFAEEPGEITIPSLLYRGSEGGGSSIFSNRGRQIVARTAPKTVAVKPQPQTGLIDTWIVTDQLTIRSEWVNKPESIQVGDPITRRITIDAKGQRAEAIPPLLVEQSNGDLQTYLDQPQLQTQTSPQGLIGQRIESQAIIPNAAGTLTLPALRLAYWNPINDRVEIAQLSEETITVLPAANAPNQPRDNQAPLKSAFETETDTQKSPWWEYALTWQITTALLALMLVMQFRLLRKPGSIKKPTDDNVLSLAQAWRTCKHAAKADDLLAFKQALLRWARIYFDSHQPWQALYSAVNDDTQSQLDALNEAIYKNPSNVSVSATELMQSLSDFIASVSQNKSKDKDGFSDSLNDLYHAQR